LFFKISKVKPGVLMNPKAIVFRVLIVEVPMEF
jgi:hypothetical protein